MSAGFSQNQRSTGGHRPPLQQTKTALRQFCNTLLRGGGTRQHRGGQFGRNISPVFYWLRPIAPPLLCEEGNGRWLGPISVFPQITSENSPAGSVRLPPRAICT